MLRILNMLLRLFVFLFLGMYLVVVGVFCIFSLFCFFMRLSDLVSFTVHMKFFTYLCFGFCFLENIPNCEHLLYDVFL